MDILSRNRCKMLKILARREKRTSELVSDLGISKTAVSRHITRLKEDGLITKDDGRFRLTGKGKLLERGNSKKRLSLWKGIRTSGRRTTQNRYRNP
ncbi:ArsR family transcriptional regulator [Archaeoglobus neptunius]|uniref:ArsR family transcriptional regulator n=1 Tax=Archaeoglobus neptunius TaxID=2798580 RepID=UPI002ED823F0